MKRLRLSLFLDLIRIRREVARRALEKLIADGRINPTRIEETVAQCEAEIEENDSGVR